MYNFCCLCNAYDRNGFKTAYTTKIKDLFAVFKRLTKFNSNSYLIWWLHLHIHIFPNLFFSRLIVTAAYLLNIIMYTYIIHRNNSGQLVCPISLHLPSTYKFYIGPIDWPSSVTQPKTTVISHLSDSIKMTGQRVCHTISSHKVTITCICRLFITNRSCLNTEMYTLHGVLF